MKVLDVGLVSVAEVGLGVKCFAELGEREAFLAKADILVCLLPDTPEMRGVIRAKTLTLLPAGAGALNEGRV